MLENFFVADQKQSFRQCPPTLCLAVDTGDSWSAQSERKGALILAPWTGKTWPRGPRDAAHPASPPSRLRGSGKLGLARVHFI